MQKKNVEKESEKVEKTEADKIWTEIKNKKIEMFALPDQTVSQYCKPISVDPNKLFLIASAASLLPALEIALGDKFCVEMADKYLIVSRSKK